MAVGGSLLLPGRQVLPEDLNRLLIIVVVLSMALTPALAELGKRFAERTDGMPLPGGGGSGATPRQHGCGHVQAGGSQISRTCWCYKVPERMCAE